MKTKTLVLFAALLVCIGMSAPALADGKSSSVSLNYWLSNFSSEGDKADQNYFPAFVGTFAVAENWAIIAEYADSSSDISNTGTSFETKHYLVGFRYSFESGGYITLAYQKHETDLALGVITGSVDVDGIRLGGGYEHDFSNSPWSMGIDLGFGISNDATLSLAAMGMTATGNADGDEWDIDLGFSYLFNESGLKGNIGYKQVTVKAKSSTGSLKEKMSGPYLGIGYDF